MPAPWPQDSTERLVLVLLVASLIGYAAFALAAGGWWLSGAVALLVAALLAARHARARFAAYVLLSVLTVRAGVAGRWALAAIAVGGVLLLQTPAASRLWPRLRPPARMSRP